MKKNTQQPLSKQTKEAIISSTALTLKQLNKDTEKKETAIDSAKIRCRICFKETAPTPRCFGHGGGGGESGDSDKTFESRASSSDDKSLFTADHLADDTQEFIGEFGSMERGVGLYSKYEPRFDPEIIAELVAKGLLYISNAPESLTLSISLQCDPKSLSEEQRNELKKFMNAIIKEFNAFKEHHHVADDCFKMIKDNDGNILSLRINLPTLALYDAFMKQLANNLMPKPSPMFQTNIQNKETKNFAPTPLSIDPKPSNQSKYPPARNTKEKLAEAAHIENEEREIFNPSPFSAKLKPW